MSKQVDILKKSFVMCDPFIEEVATTAKLIKTEKNGFVTHFYATNGTAWRENGICCLI